jgi:hypothetical protein
MGPRDVRITAKPTAKSKGREIRIAQNVMAKSTQRRRLDRVHGLPRCTRRTGHLTARKEVFEEALYTSCSESFAVIVVSTEVGPANECALIEKNSPQESDLTIKENCNVPACSAVNRSYRLRRQKTFSCNQPPGMFFSSK